MPLASFIRPRYDKIQAERIGIMMEQTKKLYDLDAYQTEFTATVLSCAPCPDGYEAVLDRTVFFPEEGGQNCDTGTIDGIPVLDVQLKGDTIIHTTRKPLSPGSEVHGKIDWANRFSSMQQHSGEHILSGLAHSYHGLHNVGFHLGTQAVTLDFDGYLEKEDLIKLETLANEAVWKNVEISARYPSREELAGMRYRSKKELEGPVRIVTIPGYDICACCAPHVLRTGEIGIIKIVDSVRYKGGIRISILCGGRALSDYRQKQEQVSAVSVLLSARPEAVAAAVARQKEEIYSLKGTLCGLTDALVEEKAAAVPEGSRSICRFERELSPDASRKYVNLLMEKCTGSCAVFFGSDEHGYRYILFGDEGIQALNEGLKTELRAKGGGREMIQGAVQASREEIVRVVGRQ